MRGDGLGVRIRIKARFEYRGTIQKGNYRFSGHAVGARREGQRGVVYFVVILDIGFSTRIHVG
jgi:hypothetical protein